MHHRAAEASALPICNIFGQLAVTVGYAWVSICLQESVIDLCKQARTAHKMWGCC